MFEKPIQKTLKNGLRVVYTPYAGIDSVNFKLMGRAGALWETPEEYGLAHFLEHLAFDGTKKYPKTEDLTGLIENVGGRLNAHTGDFHVTYEVKTLKQDMEKAFDLLSQQIMYPLLRKEDIERQRTIITQEYHMYRDNPVYNFQMNSDFHFFNKGSRFQHPILGTLEVIMKLDRNAFLKYFDKNYTANNFVLSVCGDNKVDKDVFKLSETYFDGLKAGQKAEYTYSHISDVPKIYTEINEKVQQATVSIIYVAPELYTKNYYASRYVSYIIGGGFSSRLFSNIRQKRGLAYRVNCRYHAGIPHGIFDHTAQVDPTNVEEVITLIKEEIEKIADKGITKKEFDRSKKAIKAFFTFRNESPTNRARGQGKLILEDQEHETLETIRDKLLGVNIEEVNQAAKEVYSHHAKIRVLSNNITDQQVQNAWQS